MSQINYQQGAIDAGECIKDGWNLVKNRYWLFLGIILVSILMGIIPIVNFVIAGPVAVGIYFCLLKHMRGEQISFADMFKGFDNFVPAMTVGIVLSLPGIITFILDLMTGTGIAALSIFNLNAGQANEPSPLMASTIVLTTMLKHLLRFISLVLSVLLYFAYPLIAEHNMDAATAMKTSLSATTSNLGGLILLFILGGLVMISGLLMLCIGVFFVMPLIMGAQAIAYRQVFPLSRRRWPVRDNNSPPPPTAFGSAYGTPAR